MNDGKKKQFDTSEEAGKKGGATQQKSEVEEMDYEESMDEENPDMAVRDLEDDMP